MASLETKYMGLRLRNPLVVASSGLTSTIEKLVGLEKAGAGAVVLKSIFEEQINLETVDLAAYNQYTEADDYLARYLTEDYIGKYIGLIRDAKHTLSIPVIASINCVSMGEWVSDAKKIEDAGADAIELNIFILPTNMHVTSAEIEKRYLDIVEAVISAVKIPVAVKLGSRFTNILGMVNGVYMRGAKGIVMFNRFYEPDIDIYKKDIVPANIYSNSLELRNSLRWIALTSAMIPQIDIAASTGVHTGEDAVKTLLAGASIYEVCSRIYRDGNSAIDAINSFVTEWMDKGGFDAMEEVIGRVNYSSVKDPMIFERTQFIKYFANE